MRKKPPLPRNKDTILPHRPFLPPPLPPLSPRSVRKTERYRRLKAVPLQQRRLRENRKKNPRKLSSYTAIIIRSTPSLHQTISNFHSLPSLYRRALTTRWETLSAKYNETPLFPPPPPLPLLSLTSRFISMTTAPRQTMKAEAAEVGKSYRPTLTSLPTRRRQRCGVFHPPLSAALPANSPRSFLRRTKPGSDSQKSTTSLPIKPFTILRSLLHFITWHHETLSHTKLRLMSQLHLQLTVLRLVCRVPIHELRHQATATLFITRRLLLKFSPTVFLPSPQPAENLRNWRL